ncbi:MAG: hypothetical protein WC527_05615 [Candidatus Margulisiibacteriota bacterium]
MFTIIALKAEALKAGTSGLRFFRASALQSFSSKKGGPRHGTTDRPAEEYF